MHYSALRRSVSVTMRMAVCIALALLMALPTPALAAGASYGRSNFKEESLLVPTLLAPTGTVASADISFRWSPVDGASTYEFCVKDAEGKQIMRRDGIRETTYAVPGKDRFAGGTYSFTVRAYDHPTHRASAFAPEAVFSVGAVPAPTLSFTASPARLLIGESVTLAWTSTNAEAVSIGDLGLFGPAGQVEVTPSADTTYTAVAWGPSGSATVLQFVDVNVPPAARISVEPSSGPVPLTVDLDATASWDVDGRIVEYRWDVDDDGSVDATSSTSRHTFTTRGTYRLTLAVIDDEGAVATATVVVTATSPLASALICAEPARLLAGESTSLAWATTDADAVWIEPVIGPASPSGSMAITPTEDTTYTVHAMNESGEAVSSVAVSVNYRPVAAVSLSPTCGVAPLVVQADASSSRDSDGEISSWSWDFDSDGSVDATGASPQFTYDSPGTYACTLTVVDNEGAAGTATAAIEVSHPLPTVSLSASPDRVLVGSSSMLSWVAQNAEAVTVSPGIGPVDMAGQVAVSPAVDTTYTVTATGPGGTVSKDVHISAIQVTAPPAGSFGSRYQDLVPLDATLSAYDPERFTLLVGVAVDCSGQPVTGAKVSVEGAAKYGTAVTDDAGMFFLPLDGGATERVSFQAEGMIPVSRQVATGWNDISRVETVTLTAFDPASTTVAFGSRASAAVHVATPIVDARGSRTIALAFAPGTQAWTLNAAGEREYLESGRVRATEFTTPDSMPAALPAASAFTYCSELSIDGADEVYFDRPVTVWLSDFLGTQAGSLVPVGYYDRDAGVWVPETDGLAVTLLDTDGDGAVDGVDISGDSIADDIDGDGDVLDEVDGINQMPFGVGDVVWRVMADHFTPWDFNFSWAYPEGAVAPDGNAHAAGEGRDCPVDAASTVSPEGGDVEEDLLVAGTGMTLHYASVRTLGHKSVVSVPLLGDAVHQDLALVEARLDIAGRSYTQRLVPRPQLSAEFVWDGTDVRGRTLAGRTEGVVTVTFHYGLYYTTKFASMAQAPVGAFRYIPPPLPSFGTVSAIGYVGSGTTSGPLSDGSGWAMSAPPVPRAELYRTQTISVSRPTDHGTLAAGWTLSAHNAADSVGRSTIYRGDGAEVEAGTLLQTVLSGTGVVGDLGLNPRDIATLPDGHQLVVGGLTKQYSSVYGLFSVDRITGAATQILTPAVPRRVTTAPDGTIFISCGNNRVYRRDGNNWTCVAGSGIAGAIPPDGTSATAASIVADDIAASSTGDLYIEDGSRVWRVDPAGLISRFAGGGTVKVTESCLALDASIIPGDLAVAPDSSLYIADTAASEVAVVLRADTTGTLQRVAGSRTVPARGQYFDYDGEIALDSYLCATGLTFDPTTGRLVIVSGYPSGLVYALAEDGRLSTLAGTSKAGTSLLPYPLPARSKALGQPTRISVDPAGSFYVAAHYVLMKLPVDGKVNPPATAQGFTLAEGPSIAHRFDATGRHLTSFDPATGTDLATFAYDTEGRLVAITDRFDQQVRIVRDGAGVRILAPDGQVTRLQLGTGGALTKVTYEDGSAVSLSYRDSLLTDVVDPSGAVATHEYDERGDATHVVGSDGVETTFARLGAADGTYTSTITFGDGTSERRVKTQSASGSTVTRINDAGAPFTSTTRSDGMSATSKHPSGITQTTELGWDAKFGVKVPKSSTTRLPSGLTKSVSLSTLYPDTDNDGSFDQIVRSINVNGRISTVRDEVETGHVTATSPSGRTVVSTYDPATLLAQGMTVPGLAGVTYEHDSRGRVVSTTVGERTTSLAYDTKGNVASVIAPDGSTSNFEYDALGRATVQKRPDGSQVRFFYDSLGNTTSIVVPSGAEHTFTSNPRGATTSYATPGSGTYSYTYDAARRLDSVTSPSGSVVDNTYEHGLLTDISFDGGSIELTRAICGRVEATARGDERSALFYDGLLPIREERSGAATATLAWTYNSDLIPSSFSYAGATQSYGYDADGLLVSAAPFTVGRRADNGLATSVTAPGFSLARSYNAYGEIDSAGTGAYTYELIRDAAGRITGKTETTAGQTREWGYSYDSLGRLTRVTLDGELAESYVYDPQGNRTAYRAPARGIESTVTNTFDTEDRLISSGDASFTYTADGFVASKSTTEGTTSYAYSGLGELTQVTLPDGRVVAYTYDASGRRTSKALDGSVTERYLWADATRLLAIYDGAGMQLYRFLYADSRVPFAADTPEGRIFFSYDQVGSLRAVTNASGEVLETRAHDSFGNVIDTSAPAKRSPLDFAGGLTDGDTGLVLFGARDYDPALGRWVAKDPIGFAGGDVNLYGYCLGDPVGLVDPSGLFALDAFGRGIAKGVVKTAVGVAVVAVAVALIPELALVAAAAAVVGAFYAGYMIGTAIGSLTGWTEMWTGEALCDDEASEMLGEGLVYAGAIVASRPVAQSATGRQQGILEYHPPHPGEGVKSSHVLLRALTPRVKISSVEYPLHGKNTLFIEVSEYHKIPIW